MKKQFKVILACGVLSMASVAVSTALLSNPTSASATTGFAMEYGARIRIGGTNDSHNGIRFTADLGTDDLSAYNADAWYVMVVPASYVEGMEGENIDYYQEIYDDLYNAETNANPYIATMQAVPYQVNGEGNYYVQGSLVNIKYENINRDWFGVAYYEVNGVRTYATFNEGENVRNVVEMASDYINQGKTETVYQDYVKQGFNQASGKEENAEVSYNLSLSASALTLNDLAEGELTVNGLPAGMKVDVEWSVASDIATVVNGVVTPTAYGETTVTAKVLGQTLTCTLTSEQTTFDMNAFEIEVSAGTALTMTQTIDGDITSATIGEKAVEASYADGTITIANAQFASVYGEQNVVVKTDAGKTYQAKGLFVTMYVDDASDWNVMREKAQALEGNGYFKQTANVTFGSAWDWNFRDYAAGDSHYFGIGSGGHSFKGTYDGQGYYLKDVWMLQYQNGIFGTVDGATIKNVVMLNAKSNQAANAIVSNGVAALVQNVYVEVASQGGYVFAGNTKNYVNTMVVVQQLNLPAGANEMTMHSDINKAGEYVQIGGSNKWADGNVHSAYYFYEDYASVTMDFSGWDKSFWNVNGKVAYPKNLTVPAVTLTVDKQATDVNATVNVTTDKTSVLSLNKEALDAGITLVDGVVTIPDEAALLGTNFTVTATSVYDSSKTVVKTLDIVSITNEKLATLGDKDMSTTTALEISVGEVAGDMSVKLGDKDITNASYTDGVVSIPVSQANDWGEKTVEIVFTQKNGDVLASQATFTTDVVMVTKILTTTSDLKTAYKYVRGGGEPDIPCLNGGGYFILGQDITFENTSDCNFMNSESWGTEAVKFNGTLDGRGHKIDGMYVQIYNNGLLGASTSAIVKDIVFTNGRTTRADAGNGSNAFLLSSYEVDGVVPTLKNVYVHMALQSCVVVGRNGVNTDNVMFVIDDLGGYEHKVYNQDAHLSKHETVKIGGTANEPQVTCYADLTAAKAHDYSEWDTSFWTVVDGVATPNCLIAK